MRDTKGRFLPGNPGGPGRPRRQIEAQYLATLAETCPPEVWRKICATAVERAANGDAVARAWLGRYLMGSLTVGFAYPPTEAERLADLLETLGLDADQDDN